MYISVIEVVFVLMLAYVVHNLSSERLDVNLRQYQKSFVSLYSQIMSELYDASLLPVSSLIRFQGLCIPSIYPY